MFKDNSSSEGFTSVAYFMAGVAAGGALALLAAPYAGRELRGKIKSGVDCGKDKLQKSVVDLKDRARDAASGALRKAEDVLHTGKEQAEQHLSAALQAGKDAYRAHVPEGVTR